jgi:D-alanine-D-alanine ligase
MTKKVALLVGGWSAERQVSLTKGKEVEKALCDGGYEVDVIDVKKDLSFLHQALTPKPDVVFNNLYGTGGEDGTIQSILEVLEIPYTHSGVLPSAVGMNKPLCNNLAKGFGVKVPENKVCPLEDVLKDEVIAAPFVVKPVAEGSSVGVRIVMSTDNHLPLDAEDWSFGSEVMVEQYIPGKELTVAVLDGKAQAVTEIISHTRFFDYEAKYHDQRTELVLPAKISSEVYNLALKNAEAVYNGLGCSGIARCDFRFDDQKGTDGLYFLEINTQPGLTADSIGPSQVVYNGMSFVDLCSHLVETAQCQKSLEKEQKQKALEKKAVQPQKRRV